MSDPGKTGFKEKYLTISNAAQTAIVPTATTEIILANNYTFDANSLQVGDIVAVRLFAIIAQVGATGNITFNLRLASVSGTILNGHVATAVPTASVATHVRALFRFGVRSIGATGSLMPIDNDVTIQSSAAIAQTVPNIAAAVTVDTTADIILVPTQLNSVTYTTNTVIVHHYSVSITRISAN